MGLSQKQASGEHSKSAGVEVKCVRKSATSSGGWPLFELVPLCWLFQREIVGVVPLFKLTCFCWGYFGGKLKGPKGIARIRRRFKDAQVENVHVPHYDPDGSPNFYWFEAEKPRGTTK